LFAEVTHTHTMKARREHAAIPNNSRGYTRRRRSFNIATRASHSFGRS
jgi:hypothetical protein